MSGHQYIKQEGPYDPSVSPHTIPKMENHSPNHSSLTPTRQHPSYDSTAEYRASDYLHISPSDHQTPSSVQDGSFDVAAASSSHTTPQHADDMYGTYGFSEYSHQDEFGEISYLPADQSTPSASLDNMTPIVRGDGPIPSSSLPQPPHAASSQPHLQSPFKASDPSMAYPIETQYMDPNGLIYYPQYAYPDGSPSDPSTFDPQQQFYAMQPTMTYAAAGPSNTYQPPPPVAYTYPPQFVMGEPERARRISPSEQSIASTAVSLTRSGSTSSEMLARTARPKVKLSHEDKRNIVIMAREHTQLRQEDIAQRYGVDRSTISKIVLNADRWLGPQPTSHAISSKPTKTLTARFPGVDARMNEWMDKQIELGGDIRDAVARNMARMFAQEIGFPDNRFKASAKWLDKFKDRRKAAGYPEPPPMGTSSYPLYVYPGQQYMLPSPGDTGSIMLSRSQSTMTMSSESSSGQDYGQYHGMATPNRMAMKSESDLLNIGTTTSRARSQSSPQLPHGPGTQSPSSGKAPRTIRPSPNALQRQNSYHGTSPSPRRPLPLSRANSSQGVPRRSRPNSFAASAFGITPMEPCASPVNSPSAGRTPASHTRQRSEVGLSPFANLSITSVSPDMSESGEHPNMLHMSVGIPPMTPITPGVMTGGVFPNTDYGELQDFGPLHHQHQVYPAQVNRSAHYHTMPNKAYQPQYQQQPYNPQPQYVHPYPMPLPVTQEQMGTDWQHA